MSFESPYNTENQVVTITALVNLFEAERDQLIASIDQHERYEDSRAKQMIADSYCRIIQILLSAMTENV